MLVLTFTGINLSTPLYGQTCLPPVLSKISDRNTGGFTIDWTDSNTSALSWEIEIGPKAFQRDFIPDISDIPGKSYEFTDLEAGTAYELYIRTRCNVSSVSSWNGPYFINTNIENGSSCYLDFDIVDNNCPNQQNFLVSVSSLPGQIIGQDVYLDNLSLIIEHSWPADLQISLISPSGQEALISQFRGSSIDDIGIHTEGECDQPAIFRSFSCNDFNENQALKDTIAAREDLNNIFDGDPANGTWILALCDRAQGDLGQLHHVNLDFKSLLCPRIEHFEIIDIESDFIEISWESDAFCQQVRMDIRPKGSPPESAMIEFVECDRERFIFGSLVPGTEYILEVKTLCGLDLESEKLCPIQFNTLCGQSFLSENFNELTECITDCQSNCFTGDLWNNFTSQGPDQWKVNSGSTQTSFTGPNGDFGGRGNYIYTESSLACNASTTAAILISHCLEQFESSSCQISFYYHAFGVPGAELKLQKRERNLSWVDVWKTGLSSEANWQFASIGLGQINNHFELRFIKPVGNASRYSDFALDQIKLVGLDTVNYGVFYRDSDTDGFGDSQSVHLLCSRNAPIGFSSNDEDCDDSDPDINPLANEIFCNGIDENCNGMADDNIPANINYSLISIVDASCPGIADGSIDIEVNGLNGPFNYLWSNGSTTQDIQLLDNGSYTCTISDNNSCQLISEQFIVGISENLDLEVLQMVPATCAGRPDGELQVMVKGGTPPYQVIWSNNNIGESLEGISSGDYIASVTDANGCVLISDTLRVEAEQVLTAGIITSKDVDCFNGINGSVQIGVLRGTPPYRYTWSNGASSNVVNALAPGVYSVSISDASSCSIVLENIVIGEPERLRISVEARDDVSCFGGYDGFLDIDVTGGTEPYSYRWSNGKVSEDISELTAGIYSLTVSDFNACTATLSNFEIRQNAQMTVTLDSLQSLRCSGSTDGYISVLVTGGVPAYSYNWSHPAISSPTDQAFISGLSPGRYGLTVEDYLNCKSKIKSYDLVNRSEKLNVSILPLDEVRCHDDNNASVIAVSNNGRIPLDFNWSSGKQTIKNMFSDTLFGLSAGTYNLTITDHEGCVGVSDSLRIENREELGFVLNDIRDIRCNGESNGMIDLGARGGVPSYEIEWSDGQREFRIENLAQGDYTALIRDSNDCETETATFNIREPDTLILEAGIQNTDNSNNGSISILVFGGEAPYDYQWDSALPGIFQDSLAQGLGAGLYFLTLTDSNGCQIDTSLMVDVISSIDFQNAQELNIQIYPNPVVNFWQYNLNEDIDPSRIELYDIEGKLLQSYIKPSAGTAMSVPEYSGLCLVRFYFDNEVIVRKLIILQ